MDLTKAKNKVRSKGMKMILKKPLDVQLLPRMFEGGYMSICRLFLR